MYPAFKWLSNTKSVYYVPFLACDYVPLFLLIQVHACYIGIQSVSKRMTDFELLSWPYYMQVFAKTTFNVRGIV